jgi:hypothetical protein
VDAGRNHRVARSYHPAVGWLEEERVVDPGYYVGWGTLSLINAGLAQAKDRSGLAWFLLSLLLGPVATFLIVFLDRPRQAGAE